MRIQDIKVRQRVMVKIPGTNFYSTGTVMKDCGPGSYGGPHVFEVKFDSKEDYVLGYTYVQVRKIHPYSVRVDMRQVAKQINQKRKELAKLEMQLRELVNRSIRA